MIKAFSVVSVAAMGDPSITDWLMVIITLVYVLATCVLCIFSARSYNVAQRQIDENRKQHEEEKVFQVLPWFHVSIIEFKKLESNATSIDVLSPYLYEGSDAVHLPFYYMQISIKNIGQGTATRFDYSWKCSKGLHSIPSFYTNKAMMSGESLDEQFAIELVVPSKQESQFEICTASMEFTFFDIYNRPYMQTEDIQFKIDVRTHSVKVDVDAGRPMAINK